MSTIKKSDCISLENAQREIGIVRGTLNAYMSVLGVPRYKFPLDRRTYITKADFERIRQLYAENRT